MKRAALFAVLALASALAVAAVSTATWQNATTNTDDSPIPATGAGSIASTTVEWSACGAADSFTTRAGAVTAPGSARTAQTTDLAPGRWCFRAFHTNTFGESSDPTGIIVKVVAPPKPRPPGNFSIS